MNRLHIDSLTSIGAVEDGDNPESKIMFWKRKTEEPAPGLVEKEGDSMPFDVESLTDDAKAYITAEIAAGITAAAELVETPDPLPDDLPDVVKSRLDAQDSTIEKERVEKEALAKEVADLKDEMATEKYIERAKTLAPVLGDPDEMAPVLKALATADPEAFDVLDAQFDTLIVRDDFAKILTEYGDSAADGTAVDQITAHANEIRKTNPDLTPAAARAQAWRDHPELKAQSRKEGN